MKITPGIWPNLEKKKIFVKKQTLSYQEDHLEEGDKDVAWSQGEADDAYHGGQGALE